MVPPRRLLYIQGVKPGQRIGIESLSMRLQGSDTLVLSGVVSTPTAQAALGAALEAQHADIVRQRLASFTIDVRELTFLNSSTLRLFIDWVRRANQAGYATAFIIDERVTWHPLSFSVLKTMGAPGKVEVRSTPPDAG